MNWTFNRDSDNGEIAAYVSEDWLCADGDSAMLYIEKDESGFELRCFSGIPASSIYIDNVDFGRFDEKVKHKSLADKYTEGKSSFNERCFQIADYLCSLFCEKINLD